MESLVPLLIVFGLPVLLAVATMTLLESYRRGDAEPRLSGKLVIVAGFSVLVGFLGWIGLMVSEDAFATSPFGEMASWLYLTYFLVVGGLLGYVFTRRLSKS